MTSITQQMALYESSRKATKALEDSSRLEVADILEKFLSGELDGQQVRYRLEAEVRVAYRTSASVARSVAVRASELDGWEPGETFKTEYLDLLISDIRRNLRDLKSGNLSSSQVLMRFQHGVGVAAQRGYTDQLVQSYVELEEFGFKPEKFWVANFVDNDPCESCRALHGTSVGLEESFKAEVGNTKVYKDLLGPPRHPRCQCKLMILLRNLGNSSEVPNFYSPEDERPFLTSVEVRKMSESVFQSVRATISATLRFLRGRRER